MNSDQSFMLEQTGSAQRKALGVGIVCLALCLIELVIHPTQFLRSYLFGEVFWLGIGLSCMGILMLHHLVSGRWGFVLRRPLEAAADPIIQQKTFYLNTPFFIVRQIVYWVLWILLAYFLNRWSTQQDGGSDPESQRRLRNLSGPGLVIYGFTVTFAGFDWVMSLEPHFFS